MISHHYLFFPKAVSPHPALLSCDEIVVLPQRFELDSQLKFDANTELVGKHGRQIIRAMREFNSFCTCDMGHFLKVFCLL